LRNCRKRSRSSYRDALVAGLRHVVDVEVVQFPKPPAKAMVKYNLITGVLEDVGYVQKDSSVDAIGRTYWIMGWNPGE
jgi:hypothetical protein